MHGNQNKKMSQNLEFNQISKMVKVQLNSIWLDYVYEGQSKLQVLNKATPKAVCCWILKSLGEQLMQLACYFGCITYIVLYRIIPQKKVLLLQSSWNLNFINPSTSQISKSSKRVWYRKPKEKKKASPLFTFQESNILFSDLYSRYCEVNHP